MQFCIRTTYRHQDAEKKGPVLTVLHVLGDALWQFGTKVIKNHAFNSTLQTSSTYFIYAQMTSHAASVLFLVDDIAVPDFDIVEQVARPVINCPLQFGGLDSDDDGLPCSFATIRK